MANLGNQFVGAFTRQMGRNVANTMYNSGKQTGFTHTDDVQGLIEERTYDNGKTGVQFNFDRVCYTGGLEYVLWVALIAFPLVVNQAIAAPILLWKGVKKLMCKKIKFQHSQWGTNLVRDGRYRNGVRNDGYSLVYSNSYHTPEELKTVTDFRIELGGAMDGDYAIKETERMQNISSNELVDSWVKKYRINGIAYIAMAAYCIFILIWAFSL